ncbi:MAG: ribosomal protein methyltransferase [Clostridiales bacterium]|jgi:ribosomal protein L11 methyltransferase|nr:ribosomal protein methyltransferase [Clostridiales bacterium]
MKWTQIKLTTTAEAVEAVAYTLGELGIQGIEIKDNQPLTEDEKRQMYVDLVDVLPNQDDNNTYIYFYLSELEDIDEKVLIIKEAIDELKEFVDIGEATLTLSQTDEIDWANNWKKYFKPFRVEDNIVIKPSWEIYEKENNDDIIIEIDPGMAFGSGTHETTSLCIKCLNKYIKKDSLVIDVGCGSGILGIVASKLGAKQVSCIDIDINAVTVAKENVEINNVTHNVHVEQGDLLQTATQKADIIVANILADVIIMLTKDIRKFIADDGVFISSGIIQDKVESVLQELKNNEFEVIEIIRKGEWAAIVAKCSE